MDTIASAPSVGPDPVRTFCRSCNAEVITKTEHHSNTLTHIYALMLCMSTCCLCSCWPYCCNSCRDTVHKCPSCNAYIGVYKR